MSPNEVQLIFHPDANKDVTAFGWQLMDWAYNSRTKICICNPTKKQPFRNKSKKHKPSALLEQNETDAYIQVPKCIDLYLTLPLYSPFLNLKK
jgi:hypothetical protein